MMMDICDVDRQWSDINEWVHPSHANEKMHPHPEEHPAKWRARRPTIISVRAVHHAADLSSRFETLRQAWHREYGVSSSLTAIAGCDSYQKIIQLRESVLPFIFRDLERQPEPDHWFEALRIITKTDPVPAKDRGNRRRMAKAWLKWGRVQGYA
jgi:hypothetical protein